MWAKKSIRHELKDTNIFTRNAKISIISFGVDRCPAVASHCFTAYIGVHGNLSYLHLGTLKLGI